MERWMQKIGLVLEAGDETCDDSKDGAIVTWGQWWQVEENGDDQGSLSGNNEARFWVKKVESSTSKGCDPMGWVAWDEKFFEVQQIKLERGDSLKCSSSTPRKKT